MRIIHDTPELLIVVERAQGLRIWGALAGLGGVGFVATGARAGSVPAEIVGACMIGLAVLFVLVPSISTFYFNRAEKRLVIARRRLWTRGSAGYDEFPLRDVSAVRVEESKSPDNRGSTWRLVVRLADGRSIPFTSYYTSGYASKADIAARVAAFLGVETNATAAPAQRSPYAMVPGSRRIAVAIVLAFVAFGTLFGSFGVMRLSREYRRLATWEPVDATVLAKRVDARIDSDGNTYRPEITYRYAVNDRVYTSTHTLPFSEGRSGRWAYDVIDRFSIGGRYTAWFDPANPSDAFIVRSHSVVAPVFTAIGLVVVLAGCAALVAVIRAPRRV